jgi:hypothetical protein
MENRGRASAPEIQKSKPLCSPTLRVAGIVPPAQLTQSHSGFITAFDLRQKSTGHSSGIFSSWMTTCGLTIDSAKLATRKVRAYVSAGAGITLDRLLQFTKESVSADAIFGMIAANILYVNLHAAPLAEPSRVKVYSSPEAASGSQSLWPGRIPAHISPRFTAGTVSSGILASGR